MYSPSVPDNINRFEFMCVPGYEPKSPKNWYLRDVSEGCIRKHLGLSMCGNGEGFAKVPSLDVPDSFSAVWMDMGMKHHRVGTGMPEELFLQSF